MLNNIEKLGFIRSDTMFYSTGTQVLIFETEDLGGEYELAMIAYIDMETETVVYELLISDREYFVEGEVGFSEAVEKVELANEK